MNMIPRSCGSYDMPWSAEGLTVLIASLNSYAVAKRRKCLSEMSLR
jgi:hypothetical protein